MSSRISLSRFLIEEQRQHGALPPDLRLLIETVARACKAIAHSVNKGALAGVLGDAGVPGFAAAWLRHRGLDWAAELLPSAPSAPSAASFLASRP